MAPKSAWAVLIMNRIGKTVCLSALRATLVAFALAAACASSQGHVISLKTGDVHLSASEHTAAVTLSAAADRHTPQQWLVSLPGNSSASLIAHFRSGCVALVPPSAAVVWAAPSELQAYLLSRDYPSDAMMGEARVAPYSARHKFEAARYFEGRAAQQRFAARPGAADEAAEGLMWNVELLGGQCGPEAPSSSALLAAAAALAHAWRDGVAQAFGVAVFAHGVCQRHARRALQRGCGVFAGGGADAAAAGAASSCRARSADRRDPRHYRNVKPRPGPRLGGD
jgi:hypothetical protein